MARRRVLLTGGSGFIGRNIRGSTLKERFDWVSPSHAELDLTDTAQVDAYFKANRFDAIVHAAVKPGHRNAPDPSALLYSNTRQYFNLARHASEVERLLVLGSGAIYGASAGIVMAREEQFGLRVPEDEHGFTKYVCEKHLQTLPNAVDLRLFGVYGPGEDYAIRFISNIMAKCVHGLPLTIKQDRRFSYIHVDDLMPVLEHFIGQAAQHHAYNVTPDQPVLLSELAHLVLKAAGKDLPITVSQPGLGPEYSGDNRRLKAECPAFAPARLEDSLAGLYRWYEGQAPRIRKEELLHDK